MKHQYLEVTFRCGEALAAYLYLSRSAHAKAARTSDEGNGLRVDYDASGTPIGVEITAPGAVTVTELNAVLVRLGVPPISQDEWAPLRAA